MGASHFIGWMGAVEWSFRGMRPHVGEKHKCRGVQHGGCGEIEAVSGAGQSRDAFVIHPVIEDDPVQQIEFRRVRRGRWAGEDGSSAHEPAGITRILPQRFAADIGRQRIVPNAAPLAGGMKRRQIAPMRRVLVVAPRRARRAVGDFGQGKICLLSSRYMVSANPHWRTLLVQLMRWAFSLARASAGRSNAASSAMMTMTTSNSISVNAGIVFLMA